MRFSLQVQYAICGVFDIAYNGQGRPVQVRAIGERQAIPVRYLEQIFQRLRRADLVQAKRGPGGGYRLSRPASEINLRQVIEAVEGPIGSASPRDGEPASEAETAFRPDFLWEELSARFAAVLEETSIEGLCAQATRAQVRRDGGDSYAYQI